LVSALQPFIVANSSVLIHNGLWFGQTVRAQHFTVDCNTIPGYSTHPNKCGVGVEMDKPTGCYPPSYYACFPYGYSCCAFDDTRTVFQSCPSGKKCQQDGCINGATNYAPSIVIIGFFGFLCKLVTNNL